MEYPAAAPGGSGAYTASYNYYPQQQLLPRRPPAPAARWVKQWTPQDLAVSGGKCPLFKWVRADGHRSSKEIARVLEVEAPKPEPTTEILFLCSYENCGKTFVDVSALRKHAHVHNDKQHICPVLNCGKKFVDNSKLKRHSLTHTGQKDFVCPHPGCGKAFSLDFNLRSHLKTHAVENYHICHFPSCGKRFTSDSKLRAHAKSHEKSGTPVAVHYTPPPAEKPQSVPKASAPATTSFADRPYVCPYEGCDKAYIHGYKLNLHLKTQHPEHGQEENGKLGASAGRHAANEPTYQYNYAEMGDIPNSKRSKSNHAHRAHSSRGYSAKVSSAVPLDVGGAKNRWSGRVKYEDDSEETEEDGGNNIEHGWRYGNNADDEETPDED